MSSVAEESPLTKALSLAQQSAQAFTTYTGIDHVDLAIVLGSGWGRALDLIGEPLCTVPAKEVPGFSSSTVAGHHGTIQVLAAADKKILVIGARSHFYEHRDVHRSVHPVRFAHYLGAKDLILTNGCGSINPHWEPGQVVMLRDHINLTFVSPLLGPEFVDLSQAYSPKLRAIAHEQYPYLPSGIYAQFAGPQYETPAEVSMAGIVGADLVGMSTVQETVAARHLGLEVLGLSLVTNLAAGISPQPLSHQEVLEIGQDNSNQISELLARIVTAILKA